MVVKSILLLLGSVTVAIIVLIFSMGQNTSNVNNIIKSKEENNKPRDKGVWKYYQLGVEKEIKNKKRSKGEMECLRAAVKIFGTEFKTVRPNWLKNPETGRNLEIDVYSDKLGIGIEFQGEQHVRYVRKFQANKREFLKQIERDRMKLRMCNKVGVYLIRVYHDCKDIEKYIYDHAPKDCISKKYKRV